MKARVGSQIGNKATVNFGFFHFPLSARGGSYHTPNPMLQYAPFALRP
jgi:hypothetical protein